MQRLLTSNSGLSSDQNDPVRSCVRAKIRQLEREMANIKSAKEAFLGNLSLTKKNIEDITGNISRCIEERGEALKRRLRDIGKEKISEWNRQLELCLQAEQNITDFSTLNERIGCIDSGDIELEVDMSVLSKIKNFGTLSMAVPPHRAKIVTGGGGLKKVEFDQPWGVCTDATGRILVADCGNNRIQVFNEFGKFLFHFGELGSRPGEFRHPSGIAIDKKLRIVVSDTQNHRIQIFTYKGGFLTAFGQKGTGVGQFRSPHDVAVNEYCDIAVSDTENRRIQLFTPHGGFITQFCFAPKLNFSPWGIAFRADASLMVTDALNRRLLVHLVDKHFTKATTLCGEDLKFCNPRDVACNRRGGFAADDGDDLVKLQDEDGYLCGLLGGEVNSVQGACSIRQGSFAVAGKDSVSVL